MSTLAPGGNSDFSLAVDRDGKALVLTTGRDDAALWVADHVHPVAPAGWQAEPIDRHECVGMCGQFFDPEVHLDERGIATGTWAFGYFTPGSTGTTVAIRPVGGGWQVIGQAEGTEDVPLVVELRRRSLAVTTH